jgi:hypothetical protein
VKQQQVRKQTRKRQDPVPDPMPQSLRRKDTTAQTLARIDRVLGTRQNTP